ncbi:DUF3455 domain-containing protein [Labrys sp. ZIDIC5]|uniref:DUF3455 domain-containing protein n=1 Tax=Labrys sedimenti TaxID=3106036 RepID=UPI002ACAAB92|nr:DUF3455 domain-containing protein [Labrys sp. ZIDIC5]MDZ5452877.1 DUF3455 domain-containing protein [Labrys sp. ZIDIC5]
MPTHRTYAFVAAAMLLAGGTQAARAAEAVPAALLPPAGYTLVFTAKAKGLQVYTSTAEAGAAPKWVLEAPVAELAAKQGAVHHYAGPSWEAADGSKVVRDKDTPVVTVPARKADADIPWLLIKVTADPAAGALSKVGYVQRLATHGGVAPATTPVRTGTKVGVPYTATYAFFAKAN